MNIFISNKPIKNKTFDCFTPDFDKIFLSYTDDFEDSYDFKPSQSNISSKLLHDVINYSWDGAIYWFNNRFKDVILEELNIWFNNVDNQPKDEDPEYDLDECIGNLLLMKETPNGIAIIDTRCDMSSSFNKFLSHLKDKIDDLEFFIYEDCHLIDNIVSGRETNKNETEKFYFMYQEKIINSYYLFWGKPIFPQDKTIVLTGTFSGMGREHLIEHLKEQGYIITDKVVNGCWLWMGDKVGQNKIDAAKSKNATCSTLDELAELATKK